jgi:hypothetical protein
MAINATCPNPGCGQVVAVKDEYAGTSVICPKCKGAIVVPPMAEPINITTVPPPAKLPTAAGIPSAGFMENFDRLAGPQKILLWAGLASLGVMVLSTFLPWVSVSFGVGSASSIGLRGAGGAFQLLLSFGGLAFVIVAIAVNQNQLYNISIWCAGGWSALATLWRLIDLMDVLGANRHLASISAGIGLYLSLLAALAGAATFGIIGVKKIMKS